jgi:hypothetical protein
MALQMKYFVLKPAGDDEHAVASRNAMATYAYAIEPVDKELCKELIDWVKREWSESWQRKNPK